MGAINENFDEKISWEKVFNAVIQIPGVKVNRKEFLDKQFQDSGTDKHQLILEPVSYTHLSLTATWTPKWRRESA